MLVMGPGLDNLLVDDDGLVCPEVGPWAEEKYRLVLLYDSLFSTGMKNKWDRRVYIDLYAGAGYSRIEGTGTYLRGSPILALTVPDPFDKYIFCEEKPDKIEALQARQQRIASYVEAAYICGDCNAQVERICAEIPKGSLNKRVLSLCLVDPYDFGIKFETIRRLSKFYIDFVVLLAVGMDANRNYEHYVDRNHPKIDEALGNREWRQRWKNYPGGRPEFRKFLADEFSMSMESLGYLARKRTDMKLVTSHEKNLPLYYIALFSRSLTAYKFWGDVLKYGTDQKGFDWGS